MELSLRRFLFGLQRVANVCSREVKERSITRDMPVASVFMLERLCFKCMPIGTVDWRVGREIVKAKPRVNNSEMGDYYATDSHGMYCYAYLHLLMLAIIILPLAVILQSVFLDFCKSPLSCSAISY